MTSAGRYSRRWLLKRSLAAAAAPWIVPATSLGSAGRAAASERITLGVVGVQKMGFAHLQSLVGYGDVQIVAVCDVNRLVRERARGFVEQRYGQRSRDGGYSGCEAYNEYERLLERADIDAVLIAVPDHWHAKIAIDACRAGKDVYCEKPLALTIRDARRMVDAARRYARVFQTGSQQRSESVFRRAVELVRNGRIGRLRTVHVECGPPSRHIEYPAETVPDYLDYDRWLGPAPWAAYHPLRVGSHYWDGWRRFRDYSGGKMTDWGAHHFDIAQWGLGMDESGPAEIIPPPTAAALSDPDVFDRLPVEGAGGVPQDPTWGLRYRYANGVEVIKDGRNGVRFVGSDGWVEVNRGYLRTSPESLKDSAPEAGELRLPESPGHHQDWLRCIRTGGRPVADVEIGCRSVTVCHLGNIACWLNRTIRWDPAGERIIGDEGAERWLDRPKRAPYG